MRGEPDAMTLPSQRRVVVERRTNAAKHQNASGPNGSQYLQRPSLRPATLIIHNGRTQRSHPILLGRPATEHSLRAQEPMEIIPF